jgi:DNA-binding NtrC family response regulator
MNLPYKYRFAPGAMEQLQAYDWPGNVRELQNIIERALIIGHGEPLSFPNLAGIPQEVQSDTSPVESSPYLTMQEMMDRYIRQTLVVTKGRVSGKGGAADLLGMNPSTLRARMRKLGIHLKRLPEKP